VELAGVRVAVLAEDLYEDLELWYPVLRLREAGAEVRVVGPKAGEVYKSKNGYPVKADVGMEDAKAEEFDAVVIPGGYAPDRMRRHRAMTLVVCGEQDVMTPPALSEELHRGIAGSTLVVVPEAGHMVFLERRRLFRDCLRTFLATIPVRG
jgi:pimeloyl-ACP methyl ester carboxylesterase